MLTLVDQKQLDAERIRTNLRTYWQKLRLDATEGPAGKLPENEWPGLDVYRIEATLKPAAGAADRNADPADAPPARSFNAYIVKTGLNAGIYLIASTSRADASTFRDQVEMAIRTFQFLVPTNAAPAASPSTPAPASSESLTPAAASATPRDASTIGTRPVVPPARVNVLPQPENALGNPAETVPPRNKLPASIPAAPPPPSD
jgi:hypothetical protein